MLYFERGGPESAIQSKKGGSLQSVCYAHTVFLLCRQDAVLGGKGLPQNQTVG